MSSSSFFLEWPGKGMGLQGPWGSYFTHCASIPSFPVYMCITSAPIYFTGMFRSVRLQM